MKKGYSLAELVVVLTIVGLMCGVAVPAFTTYWVKRTALEATVRDMNAALREARQEAIRENAYVGLKFQPSADGRLLWRKYLDGNGNGVLTADINSGKDKPMGGSRQIILPGGNIRLGIMDPKIKDESSGDPLGTDPVKFGNSNICSFSPLGVSSPGSLYFTDGIKVQGAVRVYGGSARCRVVRYWPGAGWKEW